MFFVEGGAFGLHEVGVAVFALVSLVVGGVVFALFDYVFVFFFLVVDTFWVLTTMLTCILKLPVDMLFTGNIKQPNYMSLSYIGTLPTNRLY